MNSQNPNPNEGQQPGTPSEGSTGQEPELPATPDNTAPENTEPTGSENGRPESAEQDHTETGSHTAAENPTEPLFTSSGTHTGAHAGPAYGAPAYGAGYGRAGQPLNFFDWIRSHGIHRGRDRWIGGVSSGIAERMGIDPLIVRGIFIVLTLFAGIGVLLYGLAWALLPEPDGRIHTQEAGAGRWSTGMTGALITSIIGLTGLGGGFWGWGHDGFGFFWALFWIGGVIYLIYFLTQRNKNRSGALMDATTGGRPAYGYGGTGNAPAAAGAGSSASPSSTARLQTSTFAAESHAPTQPYTVPPTPDAIPSYSSASPYSSATPYGSATPKAPYGGLPPRRPTPVPTPAPKPRPSGPGAPAVAITAGLALLAGGTLKALDAGNLLDLGDSANAVVWAAGAAVLGLGILLAGMRGRTSGALGFFAVVALIVGGIFSAVPNGDRFRFQNADWNPVSIEQARQGFQITGGRGTVDLTGLNLTPPLGTDVVIPLDATASNVTVVIPRTVPVDVRADMTLGNLNEGADSRSGITSRQSSYNSDKPGARLILQIDGTVSNITIQEGN